MAEEEYEDYGDEYEGYEEEGSRLPAWLTETPYWAISAVVHVVLLLAIGGIVLLRSDDLEKEAKTVVRREFKPQEYDPTKKRDMKRKPEILEPEKKKPILKLKPDQIVAEIPKGVDENKLTNKNLQADSVNDAFGVGGGAAGAYGQRYGKGSLSREGGSEATEAAVLAALHWLRRHQHPDGHWSGADFMQQCDEKQGACTMQKEWVTNGSGFDEHDVGLTALAMLAYLGYGHTHRDGEIKEFVVVMKKAMKWMKKQQVMKGSDENQIGRFGPNTAEQWVYSHSIATMAMAELLLMSRDRFALGKSVEAATTFCLRSQNEGYGWKYGFRDGKNDTSVTGWMVLALKTSKNCSNIRLLKTDKDAYKKHFDWALEWFNRATAKISGKTGYETPGDEGSRLLKIYPDPYPFTKELSCMTAVGVLCRLFAGENRRSEPVKKGVNILMKEVPTWKPQRPKSPSKINMYYWYYATYAMFQYGGSSWKEWNNAMQEALIPSQRVGGCEDGSWDPVGEWGAAGGRVYATAINAMTLEVYYRFERTGN